MICHRDGCENPLTGQQRRWCSENCRKRQHDDEHRATCPECGAAMGPGSGYPSSTDLLCRECERKQRRAQHDRLVERVAAMYRDGVPMREIARRIGRAAQSAAVGPEVTEARRRGLIDYRYRVAQRDDTPHAAVEREQRDDRADTLDRRPVFVAGQALDPDDLPHPRDLA